MKKLLLSAAGALIGLAAANAQGVDFKVGANIEGKTLTKATELVNGHHYLIWDNQADRSGYHYPATASNIQKDATAGKTTYTPDYVWTAEAQVDDAGNTTGWKLFNQGYQKYLTKLTHGNNTGVSGDADAVLTYTVDDATFAFTDNTSGEAWNGNPTNLAGWGGAHPIFMYDLAENDVIENYYHVTFNGSNVGYYTNGTAFNNTIFDVNTVSGPTALTLKDGFAAFKFVSARYNPQRWAITNNNGVTTTTTRADAEWFVEIPGSATDKLKMFSVNKGAYLLAPTNSANPTALTTDATEAAEYTRERSTTGAETFFSGSVGFNARDNHVAGWTGNDIGSRWFQVYDDEAFDTNIAYYAYSDNPNTYSTAIAEAKETVAMAEAMDDEEVNASTELANLRAAIATAEAARFGKPGLKAAVDAITPLKTALGSLLALPDSVVDVVVAAGDYIAVTLGFGNDEDKAAWTAAKSVARPLNMPKYNQLCQAYETLLANAPLHMPAEGKHVKLTHVVGDRPVGVVDGGIKCNGGDGTTTFTLKPAEGGFTIYNEYAGAYLKSPGSTNTAISIVEDADEATVYSFDRASVIPSAGLTNYNFGIKNIAGGTYPYLHSNPNSTGVNIVIWTQGTNSSWYIEPSDAETAANEYLAGSKAYFAGLTFGTGIGQYQITAAGQAAADAANAVGSDASIADKRAAGLALRNVETALNMPQPGHIYLFSKADGSMYMSNDTVSDHRATMLAPTTENLISRLFYLDESNHLLSLKSGKVMGRFNSGDAHGANDVDHSWRTVLLSQTDKVGTFTFGEAAERGKYTIAAQGSRYLYNAHDDVDAGGSAVDNGYYWTIEDKGEWIPVAGTDVDHATLCLPFAVSVREGMTVYTAKVTNGKIVPVEFTGDVIPANTPVMVDFDGVQRDAENNLVYLDRYYGETTPVEGNDLLGSVYAFNVDSPVALRTGASVFTPASGLVLGCRAYVSGGVHTHSNDAIEAELDALVGKVFTIKNADVAANRGYLIYNPDTEAIWTSGKGGRYTNDAADEAAPTNVNFHWTLVKHDGKRYLYNLAAKKYAAAYVKNVSAKIADFAWHFSDYPTAIDFHFYDYDIVDNLASATFNILGADNTQKPTRPAGMMIINGHAQPVAAVSGDSAKDGCGFTISIVEGATAGEVSSVSAALAAMEAEHTVAADYIANYDDAVNVIPGHYNSDGYAAFSAAMSAATHDAESKYYALTRARIAAGGNINTFVDGDAYRLTNAEGDQLVARIAWNEARYTLSTGIADVNDEDVDLNWLCTIDENGYVSFTHGFEIDERAHEANGPAAVRARVAEGNKVVYHTLAAPAVATYDGLGNIGLGDLAVKSSSSLGSGAETTGISELTAEADAATGIVYDLQGRRVNGAAKGLLIVNGKKTYRK